jgi:hypothetical protein
VGRAGHLDPGRGFEAQAERRGSQKFCVAGDDDVGQLAHLWLSERLDGDLGPDAGRVSGG